MGTSTVGAPGAFLDWFNQLPLCCQTVVLEHVYDAPEHRSYLSIALLKHGVEDCSVDAAGDWVRDRLPKIGRSVCPEMLRLSLRTAIKTLVLDALRHDRGRRPRPPRSLTKRQGEAWKMLNSGSASAPRAANRNLALEAGYGSSELEAIGRAESATRRRPRPVFVNDEESLANIPAATSDGDLHHQDLIDLIHAGLAGEGTLARFVAAGWTNEALPDWPDHGYKRFGRDLLSLSPGQALVLLDFLSGQTVSQIALGHGCSVANVSKLKSCAVQKITMSVQAANDPVNKMKLGPLVELVN